MDTPKCTLELDLSRGELRGGGLGERWSGRLAVVARKEGPSVLGFRELPSLPHEQIDNGLTRKRHLVSRLS